MKVFSCYLIALMMQPMIAAIDFDPCTKDTCTCMASTKTGCPSWFGDFKLHDSPVSLCELGDTDKFLYNLCTGENGESPTINGSCEAKPNNLGSYYVSYLKLSFLNGTDSKQVYKTYKNEFPFCSTNLPNTTTMLKFDTPAPTPAPTPVPTTKESSASLFTNEWIIPALFLMAAIV